LRIVRLVPCRGRQFGQIAGGGNRQLIKQEKPPASFAALRRSA
jgi:hypothetical protein